jgi:DNA-binding NarL/FixJ family response regulator
MTSDTGLVALVAGREAVGSQAAAALSTQDVQRFQSVDDLVSAQADSTVPDAIVVCWPRLGNAELAALRRLKERSPSVPVIVVAALLARSPIAIALSYGVEGIVREPDIDLCLALAVESARRGQISLPREFSGAPARPALSTREKQILGLVVMGFSNAEIAQKLFVAESTVKSHLSSAFSRLGVRSRNEATALILDPERGLGTGILAISGDEPRRGRA